MATVATAGSSAAGSKLPLVRAVVSADLLATVAETYADRVCDMTRRLGCPPEQVAGVVERSGFALVELCARTPDQVVDVAGRWFADTRALAVRARGDAAALGVAAPGVASPPGADAGPLAGDGATASIEAALATLDERRRLALLLRDSYDLPPLAVAVALGLSVADAQTVVAEARLRLLETRDAAAAPTLAGHVQVAGVGLGTLGALADGSADRLDETQDPTLTARRRHVGSCSSCAAVLDAQTRARTAMAGLPVLARPEEEREPLLDHVIARGDAVLPTEAQAATAGMVDAPGRRRLGPLIGVALAIAAVLGIAVGALSAGNGSGSPAVAPPPTVPAVPATPTATPTQTATPSTSTSTSAGDSPSATASPTPSSAPTSASASPTAASTPSRPPSRSPTPSRRPNPSQSPSRSPARSSPPATAPATTASPPTSPAATGARLLLAPDHGATGSLFAVQGSGFTPGATVAITYAGSPAPSAVADGTGSFATSVAATGALGPNAVTASDGTNTASAFFTQDS